MAISSRIRGLLEFTLLGSARDVRTEISWRQALTICISSGFYVSTHHLEELEKGLT